MSFTAIISANIKDFEQGIDKAKKSIDGLEKSVSSKLANIGNSFIDIGKKASILSAGIIAAGGAAFKMAADFEDATGATEQVFGDASDAAKNFANNLESYYGIAKKEAIEYQNLMGTMLKEIGGLTKKTAQSQASDLLRLAGDLTAMYGGTVTEAVNALTSAMTGMTLPLRKYGVAITDATATQKALEMGLIATSSQMTPQIKQAAILALIWEQTSAAQGQAARESETASGAMRRFTTEVKNLSTAFGEVLLPVITPIITKINEFIQRLNELDPTAKKIIVVVAGITAAIGPLLIGLGQILKMLPAIKVAIAALSGPVGIAVAAAVGGIALIIAKWDELTTTMKRDWDFVNEHIRSISSATSNILKGDFTSWWSEVRSTIDRNIDYLKGKFADIKAYFTGDSGPKIDQNALEDALKADEVTGELGNTLNQLAENTANASENGKELGKVFEDTRNTFDKFISSTNSISEAVVVTTQTIANLKQRILDLQTGKLFSDDITGEIQEYTDLIKELETGLNTLTRGTWNVDFKVNGKPLGDAANEVKDFTGVITDRFNATIEKAQQYALDFNNVATGLVSDLAAAFGQSIGDKDLKFGDEMLKVLASLLQQLGSMAVAFGAWSLGLQPLMANPLSAPAAAAAMIAGAAAIAAGAAIKSAQASKSLGGNTGGANSYQNTPTYGPSEYRGAYMDDWAKSVEFKISGDSLVGTLERANNKSSRLG